MEQIDWGTPVKTTSSKPEDLSKILGNYKQSLSVEVPKPETPVVTEPVPASNGVYKSGAKKGQPRPGKLAVTATATNNPEVKAEVSGDLLDAALFITLIDMVFPLIIVLINNKVSKEKMDIELLQLTEKQKNILKPTAERVIEQLKLTGNPYVILFLSLFAVYGVNFTIHKIKSKV